MIVVKQTWTMRCHCDFPGCATPDIITDEPEGAQAIWRGQGWSIPETANSPVYCPSHAIAERAAGRIP